MGMMATTWYNQKCMNIKAIKSKISAETFIIVNEHNRYLTKEKFSVYLSYHFLWLNRIKYLHVLHVVTNLPSGWVFVQVKEWNSFIEQEKITDKKTAQS